MVTTRFVIHIATKCGKNISLNNSQKKKKYLDVHMT